VFAAAVAAAALAGALAWNTSLAAVMALFLLNNIAYSFKGKYVPVVDVLMISLGFILRVVGGACSIDVPISAWILLCTLLLSLYRGLGKRIHEMAVLGEGKAKARKVLKKYPPQATHLIFVAVGLAATAAFAAYTLSDRALDNFGTRNLVFTVPLALVGIIRFAMLAADKHRKRPPTESILTDPVVLATVAAWAAAAVAIIYFPEIWK